MHSVAGVATSPTWPVQVGRESSQVRSRFSRLPPPSSALSGMMLKIWIISEIEMVAGRPVARRMEISDQLKQNSRTVFSLEEVSFGVELESEIFTRRWLERR